MKRTNLIVGSYCVNCSVIELGDAVWVVDPGQDGERIVAAVEKTGRTPAGLLLTHAHYDHVGAIATLQARYPDLPVYAHSADFSAFGHPMNQQPPEYPLAARPANLRDAREAPVPGMTVIETPGHTPGGVCYHWADEKLLLSGDTLFAGSVGRTDFPGGDMATLMHSLDRLKTLPDDTTVVPGHGCTTTIGVEKAGNPFLQ